MVTNTLAILSRLRVDHPLDLVAARQWADEAADAPGSERTARELYDDWTVSVASDRVASVGTCGRDARRLARLHAQCGAGSSVTVVVMPGDAAPRLVGERGGYYTAYGRKIDHPHAYQRAGGKCSYRKTTLRVEVGAEWMIVRLAEHYAQQAGSSKRKYGG